MLRPRIRWVQGEQSVLLECVSTLASIDKPLFPSVPCSEVLPGFCCTLYSILRPPQVHRFLVLSKLFFKDIENVLLLPKTAWRWTVLWGCLGFAMSTCRISLCCCRTMFGVRDQQFLIGSWGQIQEILRKKKKTIVFDDSYSLGVRLQQWLLDFFA